MPTSAKSDEDVKRVVIVGGGVGGMEALLACSDLLGDRAEITIAAPRREFVYKPFSVGEPFGKAEVIRVDLRAVAADCGASYEWASATGVDADRREVRMHDGEHSLPYDYVVVAAGVQLLWPFPGATTFWGVSDEADIARVIDNARSGHFRRIAFTIPGGHSWALPLYELALQTAAELDRDGAPGVDIIVVTPEEAPLAVFGRKASEEVSGLLASRGIEVIAGAHPVSFQNGRLEAVPAEWINVDAAVSLPRMTGRKIDGVPHDSDGFVPTGEHCQVLGLERAYAVGDITTFPVKQGGIASQQADLVAEAIAAELGLASPPAPFDPMLRGVLWTGAEPRYLYGQIGGGHGETSGMSKEPPWEDHGGKIVGRYITPYLAAATEAAVR